MKVIGDSDFGGRLRGKMARTDLAPVFVGATSEMPAGSPDKVDIGWPVGPGNVQSCFHFEDGYCF